MITSGSVQPESRDRGIEYVGSGEGVLFAQDIDQRAAATFNIRALGTTIIIINREGQLAHRAGGPTP